MFGRGGRGQWFGEGVRFWPLHPLYCRYNLHLIQDLNQETSVLFTHTYREAYTYIHGHTGAHTCTYVWTYAHTHRETHTYTEIRTHIDIQTCMYMFTRNVHTNTCCTCIHTHTHTHTPCHHPTKDPPCPRLLSESESLAGLLLPESEHDSIPCHFLGIIPLGNQSKMND